MKKRTDPCKGCIWAERIIKGLIYCPFPKCVKGKLPAGQAGQEREDGRAEEPGAGH